MHRYDECQKPETLEGVAPVLQLGIAFSHARFLMDAGAMGTATVVVDGAISTFADLQGKFVAANGATKEAVRAPQMHPGTTRDGRAPSCRPRSCSGAPIASILTPPGNPAPCC